MRTTSCTLLGLVIALGLAFCLAASSAQAVQLDDFGCITGNNAGDCIIAQNQLSAYLTDNGDGTANLDIIMTGTEAAVVEQVFLDSVYVTDASFLASGGIGYVEFSSDGKLGNLPGGKTIAFITGESLSADSPDPLYGIGYHNQDPTSGQTGTFLLSYSGTFDELVEDLSVGVHVIAFDSGGSESLVTGASSVVPEPSAALVFALGFGVVSAVRRRSA